MSYFVIIRGPLGSGKSTLSEKLGEKFGAKLIHVDEVIDKHGLDQIPDGAPCIPANNFIQVNEIVLPDVKAALANNQTVIFDACFYHQEVIEHVFKQISYPGYVFTLKAPVELCIQRDKERSKTYGEDSARAVYSLVSQFDYGTSVDVTGSIDDALQIIVDHLPE